MHTVHQAIEPTETDAEFIALVQNSPFSRPMKGSHPIGEGKSE
jgi:hypothetical protein